MDSTRHLNWYSSRRNKFRYRHQVGELLQFFARSLETQHGEIAAKVGGAGSLDAFDQPLVYKVALGRLEADAGPAIEELLELQEVSDRDNRLRFR